ncbi:MAG TPA: ABC transporter permease, partial [Vicinamibacterales bacterium]
MRGDLRLAVRRFANEPALAIAAILTLALGIGACTAMFSIVEAVLLKSMDVAQPQRLVVMWPHVGDAAGEFTYSAYKSLSQPSSSFEHVALTGSANWPIPTDIILPDGQRVRGTQCAVSDTFFEALGARALVGRTFQAGEDHPGAPLALVVSAAFWRARLGGDPTIVGQTLTIGSDRWRILGVMPPEFFYPVGADLWTPVATVLALTAADRTPVGLQDLFDSVGAFHIVARLKPGVSVAQALTEATGRWKRLPHAPTDADARVAATPFVDHVFGNARRALWVLMGAVCLVLVLACANVAGLLVARNALRARELALRRALGASAWTSARQQLAEAGVLAAAGSLLGTAIATVSLRALIAVSPTTVVRLSETRVDSVALAVCLLITAAVTFGVTLVPALQSIRPTIAGPRHALSERDPGRSIGADTRRLLVVAQVAITVTLLTASALTWQSFRRLAALDLGFDPSNVLALDLSRLDQSRYPTPKARQQAVDGLIESLARLPAARSAAVVLDRPFAHGVIGWDSGLLRDGQQDLDAAWLANPVVNFEAVTPGYFETMGIRLRAGRDFSSIDRPGAPRAAIVSENLSARLWPGESPIGKRLLDSFG